jgi:hypothetical protein
MTNILMKILAILLAASTLFLSTGCATILKGSKETIEITSDPSGARVLINGMDVGSTPTAPRVDGTQDVFISIRKDGYMTQNQTVSSSMGAGWLIFDIISFPVHIGVGIIVDAITKDWNSLDRNNVHVVLEKK